MQWVAKLFGLDEVITAKQLHIVELMAQCSHQETMLQLKDQEITRLTNLMLTRAGFLALEAQVPTTEGRLEPINRKPSWPQRQRELEKEDARKLSDEIERRWKGKLGAASEGTGTDEPISSRSPINQG